RHRPQGEVNRSRSQYGHQPQDSMAVLACWQNTTDANRERKIMELAFASNYVGPQTGSPEQVEAIITEMRKLYPQATCTLNYSNPLELLIATQLSAQCTDERVNIVTATLFQKYRNVEDFAQASQQELEQDIHSTGFYRNKAKNIRGACQRLITT